MAELAKSIELRRAGDLNASQILMDDGSGKRLMDQIRTEMAAYTQLQDEAQSLHDAQFEVGMRRLLGILLAFGLLALLFPFIFANLISQKAQQRVKDLFLFETQHLLDVQEQTNQQLAQANRHLQDGEQKLAVTLNSIGDAVIATDAQGRVTLLNPVAQLLTDWTLAQASGQPIDVVFHIVNKESRELATIPVALTLAQGTVQGLANHTVLIARDGREFDIADSCAPIRDADQQVVGAVLVFRNVTEEYAVQASLRDSAALVQTILNTVVDGIVTPRV